MEIDHCTFCNKKKITIEYIILYILFMNKKNLYILLIMIFSLTNLKGSPEFDILINNNPYPENIFIHSMGLENYMSIIDSNLEIYWQINSDQVGVDFKENNNKISYFNKNTLNSEGAHWIIADNQMQEIDSLICTSGLTDYHDIRMIDNGNYILQSYDSLYVNMSNLVEGGVPGAIVKGILRLQEFDSDHNLILDWFAFDHLDIADYTNLNLTIPQITWMHGNSIEIDYDENLIISNRRSSEIIKINRTSGEIIWIFGGPLNEFEISDDSLNGFSKQHDARRLDNGNLLLFDNGNQHQPPISRVVEYQINEENKTASLVWEFYHPDQFLAISMGSSQRLANQNTLINWGNVGGLSGANIMEVDYEKNIVLELQFLNHNAYKVRKSSWSFDIPMEIGDANLDSTINVLDIIYLVNYILSNVDSHSIFNLYKIDLNKDNVINILDAVELINLILNN